ncbi:MAG: T9SS type B sorting domain-containing protein, partial [Bacteroidales bacterium]|nr:T9SS type B sorting domain-containing protein [Bacteroidales bacterium]
GHISPPSDTVTVEVYPRPTVTLAGKQDVTCFGGNDGQISVDVTGGTAPFTYQWTGGLSGPAPANCTAGTYQLVMTDARQCSDQLTVELTQPPAIQAEATFTKPYCSDIANGSITLTANGGTGGLSVSWSNSLQGPAIENLPPGTYQYTVTDSKGCTLNGSVTLPPEHDQCVIIPTIITPNNDTYNDTWIIPGIEMYPDVSVEVFDRWGKRVFFSKGYAVPWDGTFKGNALPMDSYHYVIRLRPENEPIKGTITIVR